MTIGNPLPAILSLLAGFIPGSVPFGYLAGRMRGIDIRRRGSGNIGFTNVYRTLGPWWAVPVLVFDVLKGIIPVALARPLGLVPALVGVGAVLGHVFTPWLGFNGGKGVATTIGVSALVCPRSLTAALGVYAVVLLLFGFISLSSLVFGAALPLLTALFYREPPLVVFAAAVAAVIIFRHRSNIARLVRGAEPRFGPWLRVFRHG